MFHAGNNVSDMYIVINFNNADTNVEQVSLILMCLVFALYRFFLTFNIYDRNAVHVYVI